MIRSDNIATCVNGTQAQLNHDDAHEQFAAHVALMRLGIEKDHVAGHPTYTLLRLPDDAVVRGGLEGALKFDYAELLALAGELFLQSEDTDSSKPPEGPVVETIMFRDMQLWAEDDVYWKECEKSYKRIKGGAAAVKRMFVYDVAAWFETDWDSVTERAEEYMHDAAGFLLGVCGHAHLQWPWCAVSLAQVQNVPKARFLFGHDKNEAGKANGADTKPGSYLPQLYYASALLGGATALHIYRYDGDPHLGLPPLYWLRFHKGYDPVTHGFREGFNESMHEGIQEVEPIQRLWMESPNRQRIEEYIAQRAAHFKGMYAVLPNLVHSYRDRSGKQMKLVFVSAVDEDDALVNRLCADLEERGVRTWHWRKKEPDKGVPMGMDTSTYPHFVVREKADKFLFCMSSSSMTQESCGMWPEIVEAAKRQRKLNPNAPPFILPLKFDKCDAPDSFEVAPGIPLKNLKYEKLYPSDKEWKEGLDRIVNAITR